MELVEPTTEAIYRRYAIPEEALLKETAAKLDQLHNGLGFWQSFGKVAGENGT